MKIFTEIVVNIKTDTILSTIEYEYSGPIAWVAGGGGGGGKTTSTTTVNVPPPTSTELQNQTFANYSMR
ncbi:hypothetical protein ABFV48_26780, partial [Pseudomonas syringae]|uniref:hypothetical protein n=1 Tax=Pseudomonas syringae TaxID=317 RepID=UPI0034D9555B